MTPLRTELRLIRLEVESLYATRDSAVSGGMFNLHDQVRYDHLVHRESVVVRAIATR